MEENAFPEHGDHVLVEVNQKGKVLKIQRYKDHSQSEGKWIEGWIYVSGPNINNKQYERVFVVNQQDKIIECREEEAKRITKLWTELIRNYQDIHKKELERRKKDNKSPSQYLGDTPGKTAWSRHIFDPAFRELQHGTLCYIRKDSKESHITGIYPVSISRDLFTLSPAELLHESLQSATDHTNLSPADRVFGWVNQAGKGAYRGNLRIGPITCETPNAIKWYNNSDRNLFGDEARENPGLPLAILGQPKPQQGRFYVAASPNGEAQKKGLSKEDAGYIDGKGLRGRKVYPHHKNLPDGYWDNPTQDRTQQEAEGHYQEYRRPQNNGIEQRDIQNRSMQGWINPDVEFIFDISITNLSKVELGALLWLLSLPEGYYHRLGGGKPLGFGSVRLEIDRDHTFLHDGEQWKRFYRSLDDIHLDGIDIEEAKNKFKNEVKTAYGKEFEEVSFIAAFNRACQGFDTGLPIHYPRARQQDSPDTVPPHPSGESFQWFEANEQEKKGIVIKGYSLPDLQSGEGLPIFKTLKK